MVEGLVKYSSCSEGGNELQGIQGLFKPGKVTKASVERPLTSFSSWLGTLA